MGQGRFNLAQILRMMNKCAPGHRVEDTTHSVILYYNNADVVLQKGPYAGMAFPRRVNIEDGKVRHLVRVFDLKLACVRKHLRGY